MPANSYHIGHSSNSADLREALVRLGFKPRFDLDKDIRESQFSLVHPQSEQVELVVFIDVDNVFYKDGKYNSVSLFTLVKGFPLNIIDHPLNIVVGLSQIHDTALFFNIVSGVAARFRGLDVDAEVLERYSSSLLDA